MEKECKIGGSNNPRHLAMNDSQSSELLANDYVEGIQEFKIKHLFIICGDGDGDDDKSVRRV